MLRLVFCIFSLLFCQTAMANGAQSCSSRQLLKYSYGAHGSRAQTSSHLSLRNSAGAKALIGAKEIFTQSEKMVSRAHNQILFQTWAFHSQSDPARSLFRGLARLQRRLWKTGRKGRPVHVWMLINVLPWENKEDKVLELFKLKRKYKLANAYIRFHIGIWDTQLFAASHAKSLSVDNKVALITGANTSKKNNFRSSYFDLGFTVRGSVVSQISKDFRKAWRKTQEKRDDCYMQAFDNSASANCWQRVQEHPKRLRNRPAKAGSCSPILLVKNEARSNPFRSIQKSSQNRALLRAIRKAKHSIEIITPNLNVPQVVSELLRAAHEGVQVRIVLSKGHEAKNENLPTRGGSNQVTLNKMKAQVGKSLCSTLSVRWFSRNGRKAVYGSLPPNSHAKYIVIDNRLTYIGSANMDMQSWVNSRELGLLVDNPQLSAKWRQQIFLPVYERSVATGLCR